MAEGARRGRIVYRINTVLGLAEAAAAGIGLALLPCFIGAATPGLTRLAGPLPELANGIWLLTHADLRQTARVRAFMDFAGGEIAKRRKSIGGITRRHPPRGRLRACRSWVLVKNERSCFFPINRIRTGSAT